MTKIAHLLAPCLNALELTRASNPKLQTWPLCDMAGIAVLCYSTNRFTALLLKEGGQVQIMVHNRTTEGGGQLETWAAMSQWKEGSSNWNKLAASQIRKEKIWNPQHNTTESQMANLMTNCNWHHHHNLIAHHKRFDTNCQHNIMANDSTQSTRK